MNRALEFHDSILDDVCEVNNYISIKLNKAIIHISNGEPGVDAGSCWMQEVEIRLGNGVINKKPAIIPNEIDYGSITVNGIEYINVISADLESTGEIILSIRAFNDDELHIQADNIKINSSGDITYIQEFEGI
jgi:hypothetical protein